MEVVLDYEPSEVPELLPPKNSQPRDGFTLTKTRVYARMSRGRLKVGQSPRFLPGTFWCKPGDQVIESYLQSRLHMLGAFHASHSTRMSEWFELPPGMTREEIVILLDRLYTEATEMDKRCDW